MRLLQFKKILFAFLVTLGLLSILFIPLIEFIDWGAIESISYWIHWPLLIPVRLEEKLILIIVWYGFVLGLGTFLIYNIRIAFSKNK